MMQRILVPLDGSPLAEHALPYAEWLARGTGAQLVLVRVALARTFASADPVATQLQVVTEAERYLETVATRLREQGLTVATATPYGDAARWIVDEARLRAVDLIVMTTHGRAGLGRWLYGSIAQAVLARTPVPVLLVRAWEPMETPLVAATPRLLVPLDGTPFAEAALPIATTLAAALGGELVLLRVVPLPAPPLADQGFAMTDDDFEASRTVAETYLMRVARQFPQEGPPARLVTRVGLPIGAIEAVSQEEGATLVVMTTHARTGFNRLLLGSVADVTVRRGRLPVLLVRPQAPVSEERAVSQPVTLTFDRDELVLLGAALLNFKQTVGPGEAPLHERITALLQRLGTEREAALT